VKHELKTALKETPGIVGPDVAPDITEDGAAEDANYYAEADAVAHGPQDEGAAEVSVEDEPEDEAEPAGEPAGEPVSEPDPQADMDRELGERWREMWTSDPLSVVKGLIGSLSAEDRDRLGVSVVQEDEFEPVGAVEEFVVKHKDWITGGEARMQEAIGTHVSQLVPYINDASVKVALLEAKLNAVLGSIGLSLDAVDPQDILKHVNNKTSYEDAVAKVVGDKYTKAVAKSKQAATARPKTPGNTSNGLGEVPKNASMTQLLRLMQGKV
jgi:hypothetical protein